MVFGFDYHHISQVAAAIFFLTSTIAAQTYNSSEKQFWPELNVQLRVASRTSVQTNLEKHDGEDASDRQWKFGVIVSHRMRRIVQPGDDPDDENKYNLVIGAGYEFLRAGEGDSGKNEPRLVVQSAPKYSLRRILIQDRNRFEFRWKSGVYDFRYRNKLTVDRPMRINKIRCTLYASGELFWDRNHHSWNENQYLFGVQWPYRKHLRVDTYYLHQNCTTCSKESVNVFGLVINLYVNWPKRF